MRGFRLLGREATKPAVASGTFPADDPRIEIDFIVTGPDDRWRIDEVEVIDEAIASDHRPVVAVLELSTDRVAEPSEQPRPPKPTTTSNAIPDQ